MAHVGSLARHRALPALALVHLLVACTITTTTTRKETTPRPSPAPAAAPAPAAPPAVAQPAPKPAAPEPAPKAKKPKQAKKPAPEKPKVAKAAPPTKLHEPDRDLTPKPPTPPPPPPQPEVSGIVLPLKVSLATLSEQLEALVPRDEQRGWTQVTDDDDSPRAEVKALIWRDPLQITLTDHTFNITVPLRYAANVRAWVKNPLKSGSWISIAKNESWGTKDEPQRVTATFHATLDVDAQWHVTSDLRVDDLVHGAPPTGKICKKVVIDVCVERETITPRVNRGIDDYMRPRLEKALAKLNGKLDGAFDLKKRAQKVWSALQRPRAVSLPGAKQPTWLVVQPTAVALGRPVLDGSDVSIELAMTGRVAVVGGEQPAAGKTPLPPLSHVTGAAGVHVIAELRLPYASLGDTLRGELDAVKVGKGKPLSVVSAKLSAKPNADKTRRVTLELEVDGAARGTLALSGELVHDPASHRLSIDHVAYEGAPGGELGKLLDAHDLEAIRTRIASRAHWNLASESKPLEKAIAAALSDRANTEIQLTGALDQLDVRDFTLGADGLTAQVVVGGALQASYGAR